MLPLVLSFHVSCVIVYSHTGNVSSGPIELWGFDSFNCTYTVKIETKTATQKLVLVLWFQWLSVWARFSCISLLIGLFKWIIGCISKSWNMHMQVLYTSFFSFMYVGGWFVYNFDDFHVKTSDKLAITEWMFMQ